MRADLDEVGTALRRHTHSSILRERIVEHIFVGELLRRLWQVEAADIEVLRSEFDTGGYDLVLACGKIVRHIQFKSSLARSRTTEQSISLKLAEKPSGCVLWVVVDPALAISHFLWFGGAPGEPLPCIADFPIAKQARANAQGFKADRPDHRRVAKGRFERLDQLDDVIPRLFGINPADY